MAIPAGTRLGTYEVTSHIGSGGMGEVYQAHDSKLGRDVAIKVLPEQFARDPERLARFQREAKMLAALNHPNIAAIYGLEQSGKTHYLVMELVPGETLRERVAGGRPVPVEEALEIAKQIGEALEAAHNSEKVIIHRDLKPANVNVTPEGRVKVLDFGLAKAFATDTTTDDPSNSPTLSMNPTVQGVIMGTAAYMSPEQAMGKVVDRRTDVWAFGCVLYEMLTGKQAFQGEDITEVLAALVMKEPAFDTLPSNTPPAIRNLLRRCLDKNLRQRLQHVGEARIAIEEVLAGTTPGEPVGVADNRSGSTKRQVAVLASAVLAIAAVATLTTWFMKPAPPRSVTRTVITLPPGDQLAAFDYPAIAISPDGTQLAFVVFRGGTRQIFLRSLDSLEARPLAGTEGANTPFFSPDGRWLGFVSGSSLKKISVSGGAALTLANVAIPRGASWGTNGTIVFTPRTGSSLLRVSEAGGDSQPMTHLEKGDGTHGWPEFLPDGKAVLFDTGAGNVRIALQSLATRERRDLVPGGAYPRYATSGHLIYAQGANLMVAPFDPQRLQVTGAAVPVIEGVLSLPASGAMQYAVSSSGSLVYVSGAAAAAADRLVWVRRNGTEQILAAAPKNYTYPRVSPDGRGVAVNIAELDRQIWLYNFARDTLTRFTFGGTFNRIAVWTPDGKRIAFASNKEGPQNIFWQLADGSGGLERLTTSEYVHLPRSFSPDGQLLAFVEVNLTTAYDIWVLRLSDHKAQPLLKTPANESGPSFSPDGHWLAYVSDESGRYEVYVQPYPEPGGKYQISTDGGNEPVWNPNGRELFYRSGEKMMAVDVTMKPSFSAGKPKMLFQGSYVPAGVSFPYYDVSPDGQRFLMIKSGEQAPSSYLTQIVVVQNWFEELKRRVPTGTK